MIVRRALLLIFTLVALQGGGCSWLHQFQQRGGAPLAPVVLNTAPSLDEVLAAVNTNTSSVRSLQTTSALLKPSGLPPLHADLAAERPQRFRLRAQFSSLTGRELDFGSNDEQFWVYIRQSLPPSLYFCRHDQFRNSAAGRMFPVQPQWVIESLGLIELSPADQYDAPVAASPERVELTVHSDEFRRRIVLHGQYGWILEQHLYSRSGEPIASAVASDHRFYAESGTSLPHHVAIRLGPAGETQLALELDISGYQINQLEGDPAQLWSKPQIPDIQYVDLGAQPAYPVGSGPAQAQDYRSARREDRNAAPVRPRYRGDTLLR